MSTSPLKVGIARKRRGEISKTSEAIPKGPQSDLTHKVKKHIQKRKKAQKETRRATLRKTMSAVEKSQESLPTVNYEDFKAWIAAQEEFERNNSKPAPLTEAQRKALDLFRLGADTAAPEIDERDWISLLKNYRDAHPTGRLEYIEEEIPTSGNSPRWVMKCSISECDSSLPLLQPGEQPVSFARKRDAKKYAAKCTIEWLISQKLMPDDGNVTFLNPSLRPLSQSSPLNTNVGGASLGLDVDNNMPATQRVPIICSRLKIQPPSYVLRQNPNHSSLFSGWAEFSGGMQVSTQLGQVSDIYTKKAAKEQIASLVLKHLLSVEAERAEQVDELLGSMPGSIGMSSQE